MNKKKSSNIVKEGQEPYQEYERYEIINNVRFDLKPSPIVVHQKLVTTMSHFFQMKCHEEGVVLVAPIDVYLDEENQFQPDLIFISNENSNIIKETRIEGAPDLVVEILSKSTSKNDKIYKKAQYERLGVKEYWIVDPVHFLTDQFIRENGKFQLIGTFGDEHMIKSPLFSCISIDLRKLYERIKPADQS